MNFKEWKLQQIQEVSIDLKLYHKMNDTGSIT